MHHLLTAVILSATLNAPAQHSPTAPLDADHVAAFAIQLDSLRRAHHLPGLSAAVIHGDSIVYQAGFGYADREAHQPATPATTYRIASLTKPISSTILLGLQEDGRLSIDDSIKPYVPGYEQFFSNVSTYLLANEPDLAHLVADFDFERDDILIRHHLTHTAEYVPGDTFKYNGFVFGTLSRLIEGQFERPFHEIVAQEVLEPLGMTSSAASQEVAAGAALSLLAKPYTYVPESDSFRVVDYPDPSVNAGAGIVSSVLDLAKFDAAVDANVLLSAETQAEAWSNQLDNAGEPIPYGLGWFVQERDGRSVVWHYGWQPGSFSALYLKLPEADLTLLLLANGENLTAPFVEGGYGEDVFASPFAEAFYTAFARP